MTDWYKFNEQLRNTVDTGKVLYGVNQALKECLVGEPKLIILSKTVPKESREQLVYYAKLLNIRAIEYPESGIELGAVCGKPFSSSVVVVKDVGQSSIMSTLDMAVETGVKENARAKVKKEKKEQKKVVKEKKKKEKDAKGKEEEEKPLIEDAVFKSIVKVKKK